jgi:hypothetical protein
MMIYFVQSYNFRHDFFCFLFFLVSPNVCAAAYPPPLGFLRVGFWRRVGGSTVFGAGFFLFFLVKTAFFIKL